MKILQEKVSNIYWWRRQDSGDICPEHVELLKESAAAKIAEYTAGGFTSGELTDSIATDANPDVVVDYSGWWDQRVYSGGSTKHFELEEQVLTAVRELNAELYAANPNTEVQFTADTDGLEWRILLGPGWVWRSDDEERLYDDQLDAYEPLKDFVKRKSLELFESAVADLSGGKR